MFAYGTIHEQNDGFYRFIHDRIEEFFLARAIRSHLDGVPSVENLIDIIEIIESGDGTPILYGAVRKHILSKPELFHKLLMSQGCHVFGMQIELDVYRIHSVFHLYRTQKVCLEK